MSTDLHGQAPPVPTPEPPLDEVVAAALVDEADEEAIEDELEADDETAINAGDVLDLLLMGDADGLVCRDGVEPLAKRVA